MSNVMRELARYATRWRGLVAFVAAVLVFLGLLMDRWWSALLGTVGFGLFFGLLVISERRSESAHRELAEMRTRVDASETRLGHGEARDDALGGQIAALQKQFKKLDLSDHAPPEPPAVITGQVHKLFELASGTAPTGPLATVVVTNFNESAFIADAIKSLQAQTFEDFAVLVVDDASTDDSLEVARANIGDDSRFQVLRHDDNRGLSAARNTGLAAVETPFVCFLDADDFFFPENLEERLGALIAQLHIPEVVGVYSGVRQVDEHVTFADIGPSMPAQLQHDFHDHLSAEGSCPFNCHAPLLRTEVLRQFGGFDETMRHGAEDWELWQRILRHGYVLGATPSELAVYRQKSSSMVRAMPGQHLEEAKRLLQEVREPMQVGAALADAPFVFTEPLGVYQQKLQETERALEFLAMAHLAEDDAQFSTALEQIDAEFWPVAKRHLRVNALIDRGIRRGFGVDQDAFALLAGKALPIRTALLEQLDARSA